MPVPDCHEGDVDPSDERDNLSPFFLWRYMKQHQRRRWNSPERNKKMQLNKSTRGEFSRRCETMDSHRHSQAWIDRGRWERYKMDALRQEPVVARTEFMTMLTPP